MSDLRDKANQKIEDAAAATKATTAKVINKGKDLAHAAGKKLEEGGKRLKDV